MQPALFISHGSPTLPLDDVPARAFLAGLGASLPRPDAILVVSAHWETPVPQVSSAAHPETIHDFYGFPPALYALSYPAPGAPELAAQVAEMLGDAGLAARLDDARGLDHGAWVPLMLMYPGHDIPVLQLSIQSHLGPGHHIQLGRALAGLRAQNVLILASGSLTHNLGELRHRTSEAEPDWVRDFADWMSEAIAQGRSCDLVSYRKLAPHAARNHPSDEHLLPLFVALGAGAGAGDKPQIKGRRLHTSTTFGLLRMDCFAFD